MTDQMYVCTFKITEYGTSGNELPPPPEHGYCRSVMSGDESEHVFRKRMQAEGMAIRELLKYRFEQKPKPYSCANSCDWSISPLGSVTEIVREITER